MKINIPHEQKSTHLPVLGMFACNRTLLLSGLNLDALVTSRRTPPKSTAWLGLGYDSSGLCLLQVGRYIQSRGGVVTAEELAPYLDPPEPTADDEIDESYVVPALVRFGGSPEVDDRGNLLYRFESKVPLLAAAPPLRSKRTLCSILIPCLPGTSSMTLSKSPIDVEKGSIFLLLYLF